MDWCLIYHQGSLSPLIEWVVGGIMVKYLYGLMSYLPAGLAITVDWMCGWGYNGQVPGWIDVLFTTRARYKSNLKTWWQGSPYHLLTSFNESIFRVAGFCAGNSPVTVEFPAQKPITRSFDIFFDLRLSKRLNKQSKRRWFEMSSRSLWRHCN